MEPWEKERKEGLRQKWLKSGNGVKKQGKGVVYTSDKETRQQHGEV